MEELVAYVLRFLLVWVAGILLGWLLPKPKWVDRGLKAKALLLSTPPGLWARRIAIATHGALIVREVWRNLFAPGTFRAVLRAAWLTLSTGARFEWPRPDASAAPDAALAEAACEDSRDSWYITTKDLAHFKWIIDEDGGPQGVGRWEAMMQKQWPGCTYTAWRRTLPGGKSEYKSVTISEDATAEEFMDFYLDDETRMKWDTMITETQLLETGDVDGRCQVVRWLRSFPFSFVSQREYVIARRFFREPDGSLVAVTRGLVEHPAAPRVAGQVRMESFNSCWRSRTVPCPHGSGRPAVETTLLHFEDFGIPERLARFAVRHGMAGFVKSMIPAVQGFVGERRQRVGPHTEDPASFGRRQLPPLLLTQPQQPAGAGDSNGGGSLPRTDSLASASASSAGSAGASPAPSECGASVCATSASLDDSASERGAGYGGMARSSSMRRLGAMMLASGVAIALARTASTGTLPAAAAGRGSSSGGAGAGAGRAHGKRHGHGHGGSSSGHHHRRHGGSHHGHSHGQHRSSSCSSGADGPPRPRRRQQPLPAELTASA